MLLKRLISYMQLKVCHDYVGAVWLKKKNLHEELTFFLNFSTFQVSDIKKSLLHL